MVEFNFKSQICTSREQSERLLALGLKKETADMALHFSCMDRDGNAFYIPYTIGHQCTGIHAWSLHRLIEILDTNPCVFYTNCGYDNIIDRIEEYIKEGIIDTRYLQEWCLNEEE